jgi:hypothetical protein
MERKYLLGSILLIVVVAMVYLSVEGFYAYTSYSDYLKQKYGMVPGMDTASMSASEAKFRLAWTADNAPSASQMNLYDLIRKSGNLDEIKKLMKDPAAKIPKEWLTYFDDTDYSNRVCASAPVQSGSVCGYGEGVVCTGSGEDLRCNIKPKTGSRLNTSANTRNPTYSNLDSAGGKYLTQCDSNDFNCIRNLTFADANYRPYSMPTADLFGAFDDSITKPFPSYAPGTTSPTSTPPTSTSTTATDAKNTAIDCILKCIGDYGYSVATAESCKTLCKSKN